MMRCPDALRRVDLEETLYGSRGDESCGVFVLPPHNGRVLRCIASNGLGWEHVSVSCQQGRKTRLPTWEEMCCVKALFWEPEDCVVQYHPRASEYVDNGPVLHLWRPLLVDLPRPLTIMVGFTRKELA